MKAPSIQQLLEDKQLLICVGAGGVGKTSMAATMGVHAAMMGRKVLVLTIDPAKRLANNSEYKNILKFKVNPKVHKPTTI